MNARHRPYAAAFVLIAVLAVLYWTHRGGGAQPSPPAQPAVKVTAARLGTFDVRVNAAGRVGPPPGSQAALSFSVSGKISRFDVHVGESVSPGQPLAELDTTGLALAVAQARGDAQAAAGSYSQGAIPSAQLKSARAKLRIAQASLSRLQSGAPGSQSERIAAAAAQRQAELKVEADVRALERERSLYSAGIVAAKDLQAAQTQLAGDRADADAARAKAQAAVAGTGSSIAQARAEVAQAQSDVLAAQAQSSVLGGQASRAQASLADAQRNLENGVLRSPGSGVVAAILKHPGESVDPTIPVIQIGAPEQDTATLSVAAADARQIRVGDPADVRVQRLSQPTSGRVIAIVPAVDPTTQQAIVEVTGVPTGAVAGDAVEAGIIVARRRGVLVPATAVVEDPQSGKTLVFVRAPNGAEKFAPREVRVAASDQTTALISDGLPAGSMVAIEGAYDLLAPSGS
ncbi:MAG: efflux RND transporter periplasmic adaptor subunit [Candidatus Eremiobacteraeota bacterium]|nr:efflux RND transporter periplasmic adaptor subunit [Candidatus Eremiobacteraeota bacterium]MBC5827877.1 efflux RND transporter periplasmic adaptor subunit [Candidatus Eremiobacteraeota bacterium]